MNKRGYFYLALSILAFSTIEIASKPIVNDFHPLQISFLRFFVGAVTLLLFTLNHMSKNKIKLNFRDLFLLSLLGILSVPISMTFFQISLLYTKASILAVIISSNALFVAPFSYFILKEKIEKPVIISLILGIIGMVIIAYPSSSIGSNDFVGMLFGIAASVTFALFTVLGKSMSKKYGGLILNNLVFLSGSLIMVPYMLYAKIPIFSGITSSNIFNILYLSFVVTVAGYIFLFKGLSLLPANKGSLVFFVKPPLAGLLAYFILGESFSISLIIGTLFIMSGMMFIVMKKTKPDTNRIVA